MMSQETIRHPYIATQGHNGPSIAGLTIADMKKTDPASQSAEDGEDVACALTRRGHDTSIHHSSEHNCLGCQTELRPDG